jgi:ADP-dependent NAD(P)H-hydrate dehydratase
VVVDAIGMAYLTAHPEGLGHLEGRAVLTPNNTELAITLGLEQEEVDADPVAAIVRLATTVGATVVSGTATSWVASPDGEVWTVDTGGPGLGISGSGDVKAGIITGLCARGCPPPQAAVWGTYLHGRAGDRLAARIGRMGFLARELLLEVPAAIAEIEV